jgi:hypothetical protein
LTVEREFASAIYILYAIERIHWLKPGQAALTRRFGGGWKHHIFRDDSFTLLERMPVCVNPMDFRPSYVAGTAERLCRQEPIEADLISEVVLEARVLTAFSIVGAANLLLILPALLLSGLLGAWWRIVLWIVLTTQVCLGIEFFERGKAWRQARPMEFWQAFIPTLLNPISALRSGDMVLNALCRVKFHQELRG